MSSLRKLRKASPELHEKALLSWEFIRRNPNYQADVESCLSGLRVLREWAAIEEKFLPLIEEYPPADCERWRWAKVNDPTPFRFSLSARYYDRALVKWQRIIFDFYKKWRVCYPLPASVKNPHPAVLAWLEPRPAERVGFSARSVIIHVNTEAPLNRALSCLKEEVGAVARILSARRGVDALAELPVVSEGPHGLILDVPLRMNTTALINAANRQINNARTKHGFRLGQTRERLTIYRRAIKAWDYMQDPTNKRTFERLGWHLGCTLREAFYAYVHAYKRIRNADYSGKGHSFGNALDPSMAWAEQHLNECQICLTARSRRTDRYCEKMANFINNVAR